MKKYFNTTGPCNPNKHYIVSAQSRCSGLMEFIQKEQYFVIHAARQSGKTTLLLDLVEQLNKAGDYVALYCSLESIQEITDPKEGIPAILRCLAFEVEFNEATQGCVFPKDVDYSDFNNIIKKNIVYLCKELNKPVVILFDEVDCLSNGTLITFLRQLRDGYVNRARFPFADSIALTGMRNIRDYKIGIRDERQSLGSASPFNIVAEALNLKNFSIHDVNILYEQHYKETGQEFSEKAVEKVYYYTQGQPWLVNAIAREITVKILDSDFYKKIIPEYVDEAVHRIIMRRDTHIDSLLERLKERRVQKIIEPLILGESQGYDSLDDDYQYVFDLGLVTLQDKQLIPSNPIYAEVMIRGLNSRSQLQMNNIKYPPEMPFYLKDGVLDMKKLLIDFQSFWRKNSEIWVEQYRYKEAAPHLILQAFLQRVINHGGSITREMAAGMLRLDLCVHYKNYDYPIELKLRYGEDTYKEGQNQLLGYLERLGASEGWLIVFDRRKNISWDEKVFWKTVKLENKIINIIGC
jgi:AAA+ ATPase superfamily predicted ATPase